MHKVQLYAGAIRKLLYGLCTCTESSPLAKARGLSSRTDAHTMHKLLCVQEFSEQRFFVFISLCAD